MGRTTGAFTRSSDGTPARRLSARLMAPALVLALAAAGGAYSHFKAQEDTPPAPATLALTPLAPADPGLAALPVATEGAGEEGVLAYTDRVTIERGDTLVAALLKAGVGRDDANAAVAAIRPHFNPRKLQVGQSISLEFTRDVDSEPILAALALEEGLDKRIFVSRNEQGWSATAEDIPLVRMTMRGGGEITDSLYNSARRQNIPAATIAEMIRIFSYDVDFQREVRKGDSFEVYFERFASPQGTRSKNGDILFARLTLSGKPISLYRFTTAEGDVDYFHENGKSAKKTLLSTPIDGARLSSGFGYRKHPILGYNKLHKGLDFAAPSGTPIMAAGDGVVERAGVFGGYGKYVRIRHNDTYSTAYAHMSAYGKGIRTGARVKQGQIIGYVGTTGRSTGPHLHYEVMANNTQVNPRNLKLPTGKTLAGAQLAAFNTHRTSLDTEMAAIPLPYEVAAILEQK